MDLTSLLLQIQTDSLSTGLVSDVTQSVPLLDLIKEGGWIMVVLGILSIIASYVFIERLTVIKKAQVAPEAILEKVKAAVIDGDIERAKAVCLQDGTPMAKMLIQGLEHIGGSLKNIEVAIENTGKLEIYRLEKNVSVLATISGTAPMIGFFGTVMGMISAFIAIAQEEGAVSPKLLASGIYEAMITTAGGLFVGILAYVTYNYIVRQISDVVHKMEVTSIEFLDLLQKPN
ncbi:MAG: biopolymer transport protein ExbB [Arenicella sp.]|jgi:biopolymer transport protein ExbB